MQGYDYSKIENGIRAFVRLIPLRQDPLQSRFIQDEFDLLENLDTVEQKFDDSAELFGKLKYRNINFDFCEDVLEELEELLLNHKEVRFVAALRKRNQPMYHLILTPIVELFRSKTHGQALIDVPQVLAEIREIILTHNFDGTLDDAYVAQAIIHQEIRAKEVTRQAKITKRRKKQEAIFEDIVELTFE